MRKLCLQYVSRYEYNDTSYIGILLKLPIQLAQVNMPSFFTFTISFRSLKPLKIVVVFFYNTEVDVRKEWMFVLSIVFLYFFNITVSREMCWGQTLYDSKINPILYNLGLNIIRNDIPPVSPIPLVFSGNHDSLSLVTTNHPQSHSRRRVYADARDADYLIYDCRPWRLPSACGLSRRHRLYLITKSRVRGYSSGKATRLFMGL